MPPSNSHQTSIEHSISRIRSQPKTTAAIPDIQNSILNRIKGYPQSIDDNLHGATVYVPVGVATILKHKPNLIAPATLAFCNRDPIDLKACRAMKYFPPENRVYTRVTFTKCLYAMLNHSKYVPDKRTGWNLPILSSPQYKAHGLGVKIACGFEILASLAKPGEGIENDRGWKTYLKSLEDKDYFRGLMEHSKEYNDLLNKAKEYYISNRDSMQSTTEIGQEILDMSRNLDCGSDEFHRSESEIPKDDDDSWLDVDAKDLDAMLQERYGQKKYFNVNGNGDANVLTQQLNKFLDHISDVDGAEFPHISEEANTGKRMLLVIKMIKC